LLACSNLLQTLLQSGSDNFPSGGDFTIYGMSNGMNVIRPRLPFVPLE
jgi:hypothetical protein